MNWQSLEHFLAMGGHGGYVWGSYVVFFILLVGEIVLLARRRRTLLRRLSLIRQATGTNGNETSS